MTQYKWDYVPLFLLTLGIFFDILGVAIFIVGVATGIAYAIFFGLFIILIFGLPGTIKGYNDYKFEKSKRNHTPSTSQQKTYHTAQRQSAASDIRINLKPNPNRISDENFVNSLLVKYNIKNINCQMSLFEFISNSISKANELNNTNISVRTVAEIFFRRHADELNGISFEDFRNLTFGIHTIAYNYYMTLIDDEYVSLKDNLSQTFPFSSDKVDIKVLKQDFFDYLDDAYIEGFAESAQDYVNNTSDDDIELDKKINIDKDKMFNTALNRFIDKYVNVLNP